MVIEQLGQRLIEEGFQEISLNVKGFFSYNKMEGNEIYIVNILNLGEETEMGLQIYPIEIGNYTNSIANQVMKLPRVLNVFVTSQPDLVRTICSTKDENWIIDKSSNRLIIYENQLGSFLNIENIIEQVLSKPDRPVIPYCTYGLVAINSLIFIIMNIFFSKSIDQIYLSAGSYWPDILGNLQVWRLITSMFLHADFQHVFNNMILLAFIGGYVEKYLGKGKYFLLYTTSGILAGVTSMIYNISINEKPVGIGASGAIFGVVGALAYLLVRNKGKLDGIDGKRFILFLILSLNSGFRAENIDNMAHIGGLFSGFILCMFMVLFKPVNKVERV
ncbi:rhomboid family intramembrane serine protease [Anaeromicropila populeti]|uniref:Membrane associated serine protease, rhomboid family n=1 Tax=Anaeromicropila populeti TaxID=37658 RepID=A0A1I6LS37_9FIRM|nr:rhomboid family intramembrane serine protease [Anaeromicropila populeti]SFS06305.1 Membrane associated serine protease, rhomboid family [Anaeromicropila populeti]